MILTMQLKMIKKGFKNVIKDNKNAIKNNFKNAIKND